MVSGEGDTQHGGHTTYVLSSLGMCSVNEGSLMRTQVVELWAKCLDRHPIADMCDATWNCNYTTFNPGQEKLLIVLELVLRGSRILTTKFLLCDSTWLDFGNTKWAVNNCLKEVFALALGSVPTLLDLRISNTLCQVPAMKLQWPTHRAHKASPHTSYPSPTIEKISPDKLNLLTRYSGRGFARFARLLS